MCGIIGIVSSIDVKNQIYTCLENLEYRGYDSSGISLIENGEKAKIVTCKRVGKLEHLGDALQHAPLSGSIGIGHTRWATHGTITEENAHPHYTDSLALVHNGIVENYKELAQKYRLNIHAKHDSDTKVILHIMDHLLGKGLSPKDVLTKLMDEIVGSYAFVCLFQQEPHCLYGANFGSPLVVGKGINEGFYIGSDALCMAGFTKDVMVIGNGEWCRLECEKLSIFTQNGEEIEPNLVAHQLEVQNMQKGTYRHFMEKEIAEQPMLLFKMSKNMQNMSNFAQICPNVKWKDIEQVTITACGTAYYAGLVAQYWFERFAGLSTVVDLASEYRYRHPVCRENALLIAISQSGETKDTLEAVRVAKENGLETAGVVNVESSSLARLCDHREFTKAGPEIGVASTKAFTAQLLCLLMMALRAGIVREVLSTEELQQILQAVDGASVQATEIIENLNKDMAIPEILQHLKTVLFIGRNTSYPIALEGALKMKEISYIHAEGYAAGELKHGPIALIDEKTAVIALAPSASLSASDMFTKTMSNLYTSKARGCKGVVICDEVSFQNLNDQSLYHIKMPSNIHPSIAPILYTLPVQILAYHTALLKGTDIDQPRNLAKSVTVE